MLSRDGTQPSRWHRVVRYAVLVVIAVFVVRMLGDQPSQVEVDYHYGRAATGLTAASMRYLKGGEEVRRVRFDYTLHGAGDTQTHAVTLQDGKHTVEIDLFYGEKVPASLVGHSLTLEGGGKGMRLTRVLPVQGSGKVSIFIHKQHQ